MKKAFEHIDYDLSIKCLEDDIRYRLSDQQYTNQSCTACKNRLGLPDLATYKIDKRLKHIVVHTACSHCNFDVSFKLSDTISLASLRQIKIIIRNNRMRRILSILLCIPSFFLVTLIYSKVPQDFRWLAGILIAVPILLPCLTFLDYRVSHVLERELEKQISNVSGYIKRHYGC